MVLHKFLLILKKLAMSNLTKGRILGFITSLSACEGGLESLKKLFEPYGIIPTESHAWILKSAWGKKNPDSPVEYVVIDGEFFLSGVVFSKELFEKFLIDKDAAARVQHRSQEVGRKRFRKPKPQDLPKEEFSKELVHSWFEQWYSDKIHDDNSAP